MTGDQERSIEALSIELGGVDLVIDPPLPETYWIVVQWDHGLFGCTIDTVGIFQSWSAGTGSTLEQWYQARNRERTLGIFDEVNI